jgi:phage shock protein C
MEQKKLYRSKNNRMIAGVCGGLAVYFNMDPVLVRVLAVVLTLFSGAGILGYIVLWAITPEEGADVQTPPTTPVG